MKDPVEIGTQRELFVDHFLIENTRDAGIALSHPERREVVFVADAEWEDGTFGVYSLVCDEDRVRMYYRAAIPDLKDEKQTIAAMAESRDGGISFSRPELGLVEFQGSVANNILWRGGLPGIPPAFIDTNPDCDPDARYKGLNHQWKKLYAMGSADGLRWRLLQEDPLDKSGTFDTVNTAFWDARSGCYRSYTRYFDPAIMPEKGPGSHHGTRGIQMSTSSDFINWTKPVPVSYEDGDASVQMYTNSIVPCPGAERFYVGFPNRIVEEREAVPGMPWPGANDALFMASRDGVHWTRYREAWVRPGLDQRNWTQRNNYPSWHIIETSPTEWSVLITEHYMQQDSTPGRLRRLAVRPWGFASVRAGYEGGEMTTRPLLFEGRELRVNFSTSAAGSVRIEAQNETGHALPGFGLDDMEPMYGDDLDRAVRWQEGTDLSDFAGRPIRLRFSLKDADLYALRFQ